MATTDIGIVNSALIKVGSVKISSLSETGKGAQLASEQYPKIKAKLLGMHPWNFGIKRATLAPLADSPEYEWTYAFQLPADCLGILNGEDAYIEYKVEGGKVLCDDPIFRMRYKSSDVAEGLMPWYFAEALAMALAADICYAMTQSATLTASITNEAKLALSKAKSFDAQEGSPDQRIVSEWTGARR